MNNELEMKWKETGLALFRVPSQNISGDTE